MTILDRLKNYNKPTRYVIYGQISFLTSFLICVLLLPQSLSVNDGFSYFGGHHKTAIVFAAGLVLLGWFYFRVLKDLPSMMPHRVLWFTGCIILAALIINIVTPFNHSPTFHWVHVAASIVIYSAQTFLALWLLLTIRWDMLNVLLLCLLAAEVLFALLYLQPEEGFLLQAEVAYQITFAIIFARSLTTLMTQPRALSNHA